MSGRRWSEMVRKAKRFARNNGWFVVTLACILFWYFAILFLLSLPLKAQAAEIYQVMGEELEEEAYYDSLEFLAICVEAEAGNQDLTGKRMVVDVILNRVDHPAWPDTIEGVITEKYAFSSYWDGGMDKVWEPSEETFLAVQMELEGRTWPELYYFTANSFSRYGTPWRKVGDHYFSKY